MLRFLKNRTYSAVPVLRGIAGWGLIGVDMGDDSLTMAQLANNEKGISLIASVCENRPTDVKPGSVDWQRWAIETVRQVNSRGQFRGRDVIAAIPPGELFIDHIKMPRIEAKSETEEAKDTVDDAIISKIKQKLPFESDDAMIKYIPAEEDQRAIPSFLAGVKPILKQLSTWLI